MGGYKAVMQHAIYRNNQKRASPSVELIRSGPEARMDKKHAVQRQRSTHSYIHSRSLSLTLSPCFKEVDLLIEVILILKFEQNNTTAMSL